MTEENYKLNSLLKTLSEKEWAEARWFLQAPQYKKDSAEVIRCFEALQTLFQQKEMPGRESLFHAVFPDATVVNDIRIRRLMSELMKRLEEYLTWRQLSQDTNARSQFLLRSLRHRNAGDLFFKAIKHCLAHFEETPPAAAEDFQAQANLLHEHYFHPATDRRSPGEGQALVQALQNQELAFVLRSLCYRVEMEERRRLLGEPLPETGLSWQPGFLKNCRSFAPKFPAIDLLLKLLDLFAAEDKAAAFGIANDAFHACEGRLGNFEWELALNVLVNAAIQLSNQGGLDEQRNVLRLHQAKLNRRLQTEPAAAIGMADYLNIFYNAIISQEFKWADEFEKTWNHRLPPSEQKPTADLCKAYALFQKSRTAKNRRPQLDEARRLVAGLSGVGGKAFQLRLRMLELALFYESPDEISEKLLLDEVKSFEQFLRGRANVGRDWAQPYLLFLKYFKQLVRLREDLQPSGGGTPASKKRSADKQASARSAAASQVLEMEQALHFEQKIVVKKWLLEKVQELKQPLHPHSNGA